jgi:hypothetical protein
MSTEFKRWMIVAGAVITYFILFPNDLSAVLSPAREILSLSNAISPWLYALLASGIIAWTLARCFGRPRNLTAR